MDALNDLLMFLGSSVCHQIAERSFTYADYQMPLCARCMGIHLGFLLSMVSLWAGGLRYASSFPSVRNLVLLGSVMSLAVVDAALSYSGLLPSDNLRRVLSGLAMGVGLPYFLLPLLNMSLFPGRSPRSTISGPLDWLRFAAVYSFGAVAIFGASSAYASFVAVSVAGIAGLFMTVTSVIMSMLVLSGRVVVPRKALAAAAVIAISGLLTSAFIHNTFLPQV